MTNQEIKELGKVHILGIGGAGMSGIARLLVAQGVEVSGTDAKESRRVEALRKIGVKDRKSTRLNSSHSQQSRMPSSA